MEQKQKKIYCGSGKKKSDTWLQVTINPEKFAEYVQEYNGSKFLKLNINIKKEADKYGKDVEVTIDTWKPEPKSQPSAPVQSKQDYASDLPF